MLSEDKKKNHSINTLPFVIERGSPIPLGATVKRKGINFAVFSSHATSVTLVIYKSGEEKPVAEFQLSPGYNKTGDVWHAFIHDLNPGVRCGYRMDRHRDDKKNTHRFNKDAVLIDPYAKALSGNSEWGKLYRRKGANNYAPPINVRRSLIIEDDFDWGKDQPLNIPLSDSIIYELHIRGFTRHESSHVKYPGTFKGFIEKIPYLKELGITAVELLPINEFEEMDTDRINPETGERLLNFWGYHPISFFPPKASYAANSRSGAQVKEFKSLVKALHEAGIEVILDMVFNHTAEGDERGPTFCFRGIDNSIYYIIDQETGAYHNYSGCGNTLNCNHPVVRNMILDSLRYWVTEMHVDGFRFDLASILGRGQDGAVLSNPPVLERIAADPVLANTKLIAEAWDAAGLYQVGTFPNWGRWAEWNGKFRDDIRRFVRGDPGMVPSLTTRLVGSPDLYRGSGRAPSHSVNFVTCHDGFTLSDLVSYNTKHNIANGEDNEDGANENLSWNCGHDGPTDSEEIHSLRLRQMKNFVTLLFFSHGVPMILAGDEVGRTQKGNNNAYCQDNGISWINWDFMKMNANLFRFFKVLITFRKKHPVLRPESFEGNSTDNPLKIAWHGVELNRPDLSWESRSIAMHLFGNGLDHDIYLIVNAYWEGLKFKLPKLRNEKKWYRFVDTMLNPPDDVTEVDNEIFCTNQRSYKVGTRTVVVLVGK